eukprot:TRINITY_DN1143_c0_g1_i1.p1 TRINITY_DN1143_c0_g1~~TRINITY_DN1143_c0_g1_i1.p1  ORF type:complete len:1033 (-),score=332.80 TRINITY_DN1143_c0_g1_i1:106-3204(-)
MAKMHALLLFLSVLGIACGQLAAPSNNQVFSTVINTPQTLSVVLTNQGSIGVTVSTITFDGPDAALFVATLPTLPATVAQAGTLTVPIAFSPTTIGVKNAVMILTTSLGAKTFVYLSGVAAAGLGGVQEPSLQYILAANRIPVNVGDNDPSNNVIADTPAGQNTPLLGDEIKAQYFEKVNRNEDVSFEVLAVYGPTGNDPVVTLGYYSPIGSASSAQTAVVSVSNAPTNNGQTCNPVVDGTPSFEPHDATFGIYSIWPYFQNRVVYSEDALNTWDNGDHHLRVYQYKTESGVVLNDTLILAFEEDSTNKDFNDIVVVARNIRPGSTMKITNTGVARDAATNDVWNGFRDDLFTGFKIMTGNNLFILRRHFGNTFNVLNQGTSDLVISAMTLSAPDDWAFYPAPQLPLTIAAGASSDFNVTFIKPTGTKGRYSSTLTVTSSDPQNPTKVLILEGLFMDYPEDINEVSLQQICNAFGYNLDIYNPELQMTIDGAYGAPLNGEEVRSRFWQTADTGSMIYARKIASFRQCCNDSGIFSLQDGNANVLQQYVDDNLWSQTIYPASWHEISEFTEMAVTVGQNFAMVSGLGGPWTSWSTNTYGPQNGVKTWTLRDQNGEIIPNTYVMGQDFIWNGCGNGGNCDFQDNVNVIANIKPTTQDNVDWRAKDHSFYSDIGAATMLSWNAGAAAFTLKDSAGATTGFISCLTAGNDNQVLQAGAGYQPAQLTITGNALNVVAQPGTFQGAANSQVNALFVRFSGRDDAFTVSANLKNLGDINAGQEYAGIYLGNNKHSFAWVGLTASGVQFYAEVNDTGSVIGTQAVTAGMTSLRLVLQGDYRLNQVNAYFEAYYAASVTTGSLGTFTVDDSMRGYFFSVPSEAGIMTSSQGGAPFTVTYDDFSVTAGTANLFYNTLPTFTYDFMPSAVPSSSATPSSTASNSTASTGASTPSTGASNTNPASTTGASSNPTVSGSSDQPESCGESIPTNRETEGSTNVNPSRPTGENTATTATPTVAGQRSDASVFGPLAAFLIVAIALTL